MQLVRFYSPEHGPRLGRLADGLVYDLTASGLARFATISAFLQASVTATPQMLLEDVQLDELPSIAYKDLDCAPAEDVAHLLPPVDRQEVWAAGVTYEWSRAARVREAQSKDVYVKVYDAERPELFFKCLGEKAVGPNNWIGIRGDSQWNVPEPELTMVLNPALGIVGYTIGNDVSSRDIEGENPLYLPQAKVYHHSCALGPAITLADDDLDANSLHIKMNITRKRGRGFTGFTTTGEIHRDLGELAGFLGRYQEFSHGVLLMTGTGVVPPDDFTLQDGDEVDIRIKSLGNLRNVVRQM